VLLNLCINARDALDGAGTLRIIVREAQSTDLVCTSCRGHLAGDFVELVVSDDGPGIPPEVMGRIFEPFFSTKEVGKGTGMGLAVVHGVVHDHGGHVVVQASPGLGTTFRILLPPAREPGLAQAPAQTSSTAPRAAGSALQGRVLVADDDQSVAEVMRELLQTWGLEVDVAAGPEEALSMLGMESKAYDLVIADQTMPGMNGLQLAGRIAGLSPAPPIVLYTGYADDLGRQEMDAAGVQHLMRKPIDPLELRTVLARCIDAGRVKSRI
jgi:CheY-like chemotaxis protein